MATEKKYPSISFFCPAHNEEENIPVLIPRVHEFLKSITDTFEILIIENGSKDKTPQIADELAKKFPEVRAIHYPRGLGYGGAVREGFLHTKYEYICYTDADNQYDIRELTEGFAILDDADVASGYVRQKAVSFGRKIQSLVWNIMVRLLFGVAIRDINCSMKVYKRKVLDAIEIESISAFIDAEMLIKAKWAGFTIKQFPVTHFERTSGVAIGSSRSVILDTIKDALRFWQKSFTYEILIFAGAFLVRALYAVCIHLTAGEHGFIAFSDAEYFYYGAAKNLLLGHGFSIATNPPYYPDAYHTPLYPLFIAALLALRLNLFGVILFQSIFAAGIVVLAYRIAKKLSGSTHIALGVGILSMLEPMSIYWNGLLMSDVFFAFLMLMSFDAFISRRNVTSAVFLGLAALTRPIALTFLPVYLLFISYKGYAEKERISTTFQKVVAMALIVAIFVAPWFARNKIAFNTWQYTSAGWYDLFVAPTKDFAIQQGIHRPHIDPDNGHSDSFTRFSFAYTPQYKAASLSAMQSDPLEYLRFQIGRSLSSLFTDRYEYLITVVLASELPGLFARIPHAAILFVLSAGRVFWLSVYILSLVALIDRRTRQWGIFFAILFGINAGISGGINPGGSDMSRYSLPFYGILFTFAGIGLAQLSRFFRRIRRS